MFGCRLHVVLIVNEPFKIAFERKNRDIIDVTSLFFPSRTNYVSRNLESIICFKIKEIKCINMLNYFYCAVNPLASVFVVLIY